MLVLGPYISIVDFCHCYSITYMYVPTHIPEHIQGSIHTHVPTITFSLSQLLLLSTPFAPGSLWSYSCFHALQIHLDLIPFPYNIPNIHSSGPWVLSFCLLFLLLLSRLGKAPPNRLSIGIQRLSLAVHYIYNGNVQCFFFLQGLDTHGVSLFILCNSTAQARC